MPGSFHKCSYCGQMIPGENLYCPNCGGPQVYQPAGQGVRLALDPWIITDPQARSRFEVDPVAVEALVNTWRNDPDHAQTRRLQQEIAAAQEQGAVAPAGSYYFCCPWSPVYTASRDVTIDGRHLRRGQQFILDVSAEGLAQGRPFKREILVGDFQPTADIDYCLPGQEPDADD